MVLSNAALATFVPKNVLLLISDDLRAELDVPGFACTAAQCSTPHLQSLATSTGAIVFNRAYVQQSLCAPTRNSFLTGRRPDTTKSWNFVDHFREQGIGADWQSLPQVFKEANLNYTVVGTGKVFHPHLPPNFDVPLSWDSKVASGEWASWMYPSEPRCPNGTVWCAIPEPTTVKDFEDTQITAVALELLANVTNGGRGSEPGAPWFLAIGWRKPHVQWRVPAAFLKGIPAQSVTLPKHPYFPSDAPDIAFHRPENDFLEPFTDVVSCGGVSLMAPNATFPSHCVKAWRRAYHAGVSFMDAQVGIVIDALSAIPGGESDRTLVVFFGDHGWQLGEWAEWEKFTNFELAARVPLIFRAPWLSHPEVSGGSVTNTLVELVDVMPTLIELALGGTEKVPTGCEGVSLAPYFNTTHMQRRRIVGKTAVFSQFPRCCTPGAPLWKSNDCDDVPRSKVWKLRYLLTNNTTHLLAYFDQKQLHSY